MPIKKSASKANNTEKKSSHKKNKTLKDAENMVNEIGDKAYDMANEAGKAVSKAVNKKNVEKTKEYASKIAFGIKSNAHVILAVVALLIGISILWDIIVVSLEIAVGIAFLILAYLLATDFFKKDKKK